MLSSIILHKSKSIKLQNDQRLEALSDSSSSNLKVSQFSTYSAENCETFQATKQTCSPLETSPDERFKVWQVENFASCLEKQDFTPRNNTTISSLKVASSAGFRDRIEQEFIEGSEIASQTSAEESEQ